MDPARFLSNPAIVQTSRVRKLLTLENREILFRPANRTELLRRIQPGVPGTKNVRGYSPNALFGSTSAARCNPSCTSRSRVPSDSETAFLQIHR
jgi:hypothetical protein